MDTTDKIIIQAYKSLGLTEMGGKGSGNWGHRGRKGKRGGSLPKSGGGKKVSRRSRYRTENAISSSISTSDWDKKNYRKRFREATGHELRKAVTLDEAKAIAQSIEGMPQARGKVFFRTHSDVATFQESYGYEASGIRAFYGWDGEINFGSKCSKELAAGKTSGRDTVRHEFAHHIDYSARPGTFNARSTLQKGKGIFSEAKRSGNFMSKHARSNEREFFAESFEALAAAAARGDPGSFKKAYPEGHEMVNHVLGDRMPEEWK